MEKDSILKTNKSYWNTNADARFGTTALPTYGVNIVTEDDLHLFGDDIFIFSWHHSLNYCVARSSDLAHNVIEDGKLIFSRSYFNESYFTMPVDGCEIVLCNRKISTYINALAEAGFYVEQMIEQTDDETMKSDEDENSIIRKAKMLPISVCFKARKL